MRLASRATAFPMKDDVHPKSPESYPAKLASIALIFARTTSLSSSQEASRIAHRTTVIGTVKQPLKSQTFVVCPSKDW